ncbi:MAG: hypothetical protein J6A16_06185 [Oscillospiraceae bacterium]|nr:hypothetical protein [Oscillospiraceae bacterium]
MKDNEKLLDAIGEVDETLVPDIAPLKKRSAVKWAALGGACCAAAVAGVVIFGASGQSKLLTPVPSAEELASLPKLSAEMAAGTMGFEGYMVYDISELDDGNPWREEMQFGSLPVYKNLAYSEGVFGAAVYLSEDEMRTIAEDAAERLDVTVTGEELVLVGDLFGKLPPEGELAEAVYQYTAVCDGERFGVSELAIRVNGDGCITVDFGEGAPLPDEYSFSYHDTDDAEAAVTTEYLLQTFSGLIGFDDPVICYWGDRTIYADRVMNYRSYDGGGDVLQDILNFNLGYAEFAPNDNGVLMLVRIRDELCAAEKLGDYPVITAQRAREKLLCGEYITTVPSMYLKDGVINEEDIVKTELVYRSGNGERYYQPYYRILVGLYTEDRTLPEGMLHYGAYYVPAVSEEYLTDIPTWNGSFNG